MDFSSSVEDLGEVRKKVKVTIPAEAFSKEVEKGMSEVSQKASIKGFRPGKAPRQLIEKMHGKRVHFETVDRLVSESLNEVLKQNSFSVVGAPEVNLQSIDAGKDFEYEATFAIFPKPEVTGYESFKVSVPKRLAKDEEVEEVVQNLLRSKSTIRKIESRDVAEAGDVVDSELQVLIPGEEEGRPEPFVLKLGDKKIPEEIENAIIGMRIGETKDVASQLSDNHPNEKLRGAPVTYRITIKGLSEQILPDFNDYFAKSLGGEEQTVLELKMAIRKQIEKDYEGYAREQVKTTIIRELAEKHKFAVPQELIEDELRAVVVQRGKAAEPAEGEPPFDLTPFREEFQEEAEKRVRSAIVIDRVAENESLHATSEELDTYFKDLADSYGVRIDQVKKFYSERNRLLNVFVEVSRRKVLDFLADRAEVTYTEDS